MANVWQLPHRYSTSKYHTVKINSGSKDAFQIGSSPLKILVIHENGVVTFTDEQKNEIWTSRPLQDNGDGTLEFKG